MIVDQLAEVLDRGESEAIVLAEELRCSAILMDEAAGRRVAFRRSLVLLGTRRHATTSEKDGLSSQSPAPLGSSE